MMLFQTIERHDAETVTMRLYGSKVQYEGVAREDAAAHAHMWATEAQLKPERPILSVLILDAATEQMVRDECY